MQPLFAICHLLLVFLHNLSLYRGFPLFISLPAGIVPHPHGFPQVTVEILRENFRAGL